MRAFPGLLLFCVALSACAAEVRVWQGTLTLPTTVEGPPDPNPPFDIFATTRFNYPYTMRDNLTGERKEIAWRALFLENEYLKCSVLPDIGGHLYTCLDKVNGQPMFYANPSIKKAQIGYRGAWAAFGIEFNFPVSHNWVSMSPVDFDLRRNPDGSASILVSNVDRVYGMQWTVELILRPASALLEERVTLYNRSDVRHRYYWWNNAAVRVWDDSRICYPMRWTASHGFTHVDTWPVDSTGADLSLIRNQTRGPVSLFVHGSREPFMGVYHPHTDAGVAHYADFAELPGKKIWSWGVDADGLDWRRALSDDNSAYVEVQAGLMRNQETYAFLEPRQSVHFSEFWMPVRGLGGIARANLSGVLNLRRENGRLIAAFNANQAYPNARLRLLEGARVLYEATAALAPAATWSHAVDAPASPASFELHAADGRLLMRHTEGVYDWSPESDIQTGPQPREPLTDPLDIGANQELNGNLLAAYDTYSRAGLRLPAGRLAAALLRYDDAVRWLAPIQPEYTGEPAIAYYLGLAYAGLGRDRDARTQFEAAFRMPSYRAAAGLQLAELAARAGDTAAAIALLRANSGDPRPREELAALESAPTKIELASDPERVLALASTDMRLGLWRRAIDVLSRQYPNVPPEQKEPGAPLPQNDPLVAYYRAFCREKLGENAADDYDAASRMSAAYVFPGGAQSLAVLEAAVRARPNDATAHYLLGDLRLASGKVDQAVDQWQTARRLNPSIPVLAASLGRVLLHIRREPKAALEVYLAGLPADSRNFQIYSGIDDALSILGAPAAERVAAVERYPDRAAMPIALVYALALSYAEGGRFADAEALFRNRFFPREEGGANVRQVWIRVRTLEAAHASCAAALPILDSLGSPVAGLPFTQDGLDPFLAEAGNQPELGAVEARCGRAAAAAHRLDALSTRGDPASAAFGFQLARALPGFDSASWTARLRAVAPRAQSQSGSAWSTFVSGLIQQDLGDPAAAETLRSVFLLADGNLAHHHARLAQGGRP